MFGGSRQGGGGSQFVTLTGLFNTSKGTGMIGSISPDVFNTVIALMDECHQKGVDLVFFVGENKTGKGKAAAFLSATVGRPREERAPQGRYGAQAPSGGGRATTPSRTNSKSSGNFGGSLKESGKNPPKDPIDKYLETEPTQ